MILLVLIVLAIIAAVVAPRFLKDQEADDYNRAKSFGLIRWAIRGVCGAIAIVCFLMTSCLVIDSDSVGHLKRIYFGKSMPQGRIIANVNEKGPQAEILPPGFHHARQQRGGYSPTRPRDSRHRPSPRRARSHRRRPVSGQDTRHGRRPESGSSLHCRS